MNHMLSNCQWSYCAQRPQLQTQSFIPIQCHTFIPFYINNINNSQLNNQFYSNESHGFDAQNSSYNNNSTTSNNSQIIHNSIQHSHNSQVSQVQSDIISHEMNRRNDTVNCEQCVPCVLRKPTLPSINQINQFTPNNQNYHFNHFVPMKDNQVMNQMNNQYDQYQQNNQFESENENGILVEVEEEEEGSNDMDEDLSDEDDLLYIPPKEQLPLTPYNLRFYKNLYWFEKVKRIEEWLEEESNESL